MDAILQALFFVWPFLHAIAALAVIIKAWLIFSNKGFDMPKLMISFFRIYSKRDIIIQAGKKRGSYMLINNLVNFYLYAWLFITATLFLIMGGMRS